MKKATVALCVVLLLFIIGCGKGFHMPESTDFAEADEQLELEPATDASMEHDEVPPESPTDSDIEDKQTHIESTPTPVPLYLSDLRDSLNALDLTEASLTYHGQTEETYPALAALRAERYFEEIKAYDLWGFPPPGDWKGNDEYFQLRTPEVVMTSPIGDHRYRCVLHLKTEKGEGWFILPESGYGLYDRWIYSIFKSWFTEAKAASLHGGAGTPLTAAELDYFREYTTPAWAAPAEEWIICSFFTSHYSDPRDMDAESFLAYCTAGRKLKEGDEEDEAEWQLVAQELRRRGGEYPLNHTLNDLDVPCRRLPRAEINEILMKYVGITVEEMRTDWTKEELYVPETDCFYVFTSDFGPGKFEPAYGEKNGDIVTLWTGPDETDLSARMMKLQKDGEIWRILSHEAVDW